MYTCPSCGAADVDGLAQCACGADLAVLQCLDALPDAWFNQGLKAMERQAVGEALEWFAACCRSRPSDAPAHRALARAWAQLEQWEDAQRALDQSARSDPESPDLTVLRTAVEQARNMSNQRSVKASRQDAPAKRRSGRKRKRNERS
jgi:tetratricopeptide (TPR) repeat protein